MNYGLARLLAPGLLALFALPAFSAGSDLIAPSEPRVPIDGDHRQPVGIEGNGIHLQGIEGNGIVQRRLPDSVAVNGTALQITPGRTKYSVDGRLATAATLQPGQVARVRGSEVVAGTMLARSVRIDHLLRGPIDAGSIDLEARSFSVFGQPVRLAGYAILADGPTGELALEDLTDGDFVLVSGALDPQQRILVARVERQSGALEHELSGAISLVEPGALTFMLGPQIVDYSSAQLVNLTAGAIATGLPVEVCGMLNMPGGKFMATRIAPLEIAGGGAGLRGEQQGFVSAVAAPGDFYVGSLRILTGPGTIYARGQAADVASGRFIEAEGAFDAQGNLLADRVAFDESLLISEVRVEAVLEAVDVPGQRVRLFGLDVAVTPGTSLRGLSGSDELASLAAYFPGQTIEVKGFTEADGRVVATRLRQRQPGNEFVQGRLVIAGNNLTLLGLQVWLYQHTQFLDADGTPLDLAAFLAAAGNGALVKIDGSPAPGGIDADELQLELEEPFLP